MTDVYINNVQVNSSTITCNITSESLDTSYGVFNEAIPYNTKAVNYSLTGNAQKYQFNITLFLINNGIFIELLNKTKDIYNELLDVQLINKLPVLIETNDTNVYFDFKKVFIIVDSFRYELNGQNGIKHLDIEIRGTIHGVPVSEGGDIPDDDPWGSESSFGITEYEVGFIEVGYA